MTSKFNIDIASEIGNILTYEDALSILKNKTDDANFSKIQQIKTEAAVVKISNAVVLCDPDSVFINTGSPEDRQHIRDMAIENGEEAKLTMDNHTIHYDLKEEQGRITDRTYYMANPEDEISSLAKRMTRDEGFDYIKNNMKSVMKGRQMIVGFYNRGPIKSPASNPSIEVTSSFYVSHSADMLYRNTFADFDSEVERAGHMYANIHSEGLNRSEDLPNARVLMDRSAQTTYSMFCTYAGNTLLMKKGNHRFSVDRAVYENRGTELSEHMFITGIDGPNGRVTWFAGAAPSGCGKTTTAMAGTHFIGDDLAQMWIDENGSIRSINPEAGIFGIVEDVNWEGDPGLMKLLREPGTEVIWSNVMVDDKKVPHWTGNGEDCPDKGFNFQGEWEKSMKCDKGKDVPVSHPNARATLVSTALENYSEKAEDPNGVETRVITYSGRDSNTMPPVWVARDFEEGVAIGATIVSAATATEVGASGVKRAPWANAPFIPGALSDYMDAQFKFFGNDKIAADKKPIMAGLNYFLTEESRGGNSSKLLGEKKDVKPWMAWLERRANGEVEAIETPIGFIPKYEDLKNLFSTIIDKDYPEELYMKQFSIYIDNIVGRIDMQKEAYGKEKNIPQQLFKVLSRQKEELTALKERCGAVVTPDQI